MRMHMHDPAVWKENAGRHLFYFAANKISGIRVINSPSRRQQQVKFTTECIQSIARGNAMLFDCNRGPRVHGARCWLSDYLLGLVIRKSHIKDLTNKEFKNRF